jgi:hypothetical protein
VRDKLAIQQRLGRPQHHLEGAHPLTSRPLLFWIGGILPNLPRRACAGVAIALFMATGLSGCQKISHTRVKMTATVETNTGSYTGSSVQEYACRHSLQFMGDTAECHVRGDAVTVDLKDKGYLFLIFDTPGSHSEMSMPIAVLSVVTDDPLSANTATVPDEWTVPISNMPLMVKFGDLNDAGSIQPVNPADLAASFGGAVKTISVKIEKTSAPIVPSQIEQILPWMSDKKDPLYYGSTSTPFSRTLSISRFTSRRK